LDIKADKILLLSKPNSEEMMPNNLQPYHKMKLQLSQWLPLEGSTRIRNMALFLTGLYLSGKPHLSKIVPTWPLWGKLPSLTNRLWRFLNHPKLEAGSWYAPLAGEIVKRLPTGAITLVIDSTKVGFYHRWLSIGVTFKKRTLPLVWSVHRGSKGQTKVEEQLA
jgi:hypothetical protein